MSEEFKRVRRIANDPNHSYDDIVHHIVTEACGEIFMKYIKGDVLELGPAEGVMTDYIMSRISQEHYSSYTVVDAGDVFVKSICDRNPLVEGFVSLFEDYKPNKKYDVIIMGHVLEHVENPQQVLGLCKSWLKNNGCILCAVPNSKSLHRQAAVYMGLLKDEKSFSEADKAHGHRRVYDFSELIDEFLNSGLRVTESGGYWLKPLSNKQIENNWNEKMIEAFIRLGVDYPEIAAEIYVIASYG